MALYNVFQTNALGAMTFTGNTMGLSKATDSAQAGTANAIGAYITTNTASNTTSYPNGTTLTISDNSSQAVLNLPKNGTVQTAYLIWGGSSIVRYGQSGEEDNQSLVGNSINFQYPTSAPTTTPVTYQTQAVSPGGKQRYPTTGASASNPNLFYTNWADVTSYVKYSGTYTVSGVVGTTAQLDNSLNCCGWLLAVLYKNSFLPARHFSLSIGVDFVNVGTPIDISKTNFTTPIYNSPKGRLLLAALNGDATITGDQVLLGPNTTNLTPLSGPQNLVNNFFGSQINDDTGNTDTSGTFGNRNQDIHTATNMIAGRQGIDITNVDGSPGLSNNQTSVNVRFNTTNDTYFISAVGTQIDISSPVFDTSTITADKKYVKVGDIVHFTIKVINTGDVLAQYVTLKDILPPEFSFVTNSLKIDGIPYPQDVTQVVPLKELNHNQSTTLDFSATVDAPVTGGGYTFINRANLNYSFKIPGGDLVKDFQINPNIMYIESIALIPLFSKEAITSNSIGKVAAIGNTIDYTIDIVNINSSSHNSNTMINTILKDTLPSGLTYKTGSLSIDNVPSSDNLSSINVGTIPYNTLKSIKFTAEVTGPPNSDSKYVNSADINYEFTLNDGTILSNSMSSNNDIYSDSIVIIPNVSKTSTSSNANHNIAAIGDTIDYTITVTNPSTSSTIQNVILNDTLPTGLTYKIGSLSINNVPSSDSLTSINVGNIDANSTTTVKFTANVTATPSSDLKYVNSTVVNYEFLAPDGTALSNNVTANNTIYSDSVLITPIISKTAISSNTSPTLATIGDTIDYTITINNTNASFSIENAILNDTLPTGLTYKTGSLTVNSISSSDNLSSINLGNIPPSSTTIIKFTVDVTSAPATDSKYINTAMLNYSFLTPDGTSLNNSVSANNTIYSNIIIPNITKTAISSNNISNVVTIGDTINYTITIVNTDTSVTIQDAVLNDTLPSGLNYKTGSLSINSTSSSDNLSSINLGNISPNSTTTIKFTANVIGNPASDSKYVNLATLNYEFLAPDGTTLHNNVSTNNTIYSNSIVITPIISKTAISSNSASNTATIGDTIDYTISINNTSTTNTIQNVILDDLLPTGLTYKAGSLLVNDISSSDNLSSVNLGNISPTSTTTVKFTVNVTGNPTNNSKYINSATVNYSFLTPDNTTINNKVSTINTVYSTSVVITPNITKTAVSSNLIANIVDVGDTIEYSIIVSNSSKTNSILNSILNDSLPNGLTYKAGSLSINGISSSDNLSSIKLGNINPNTNITIKFSVDVTGNPINNKYINSATLNYEFLTPDGNTLNNTISANNTLYSSSVVIKPTITKVDTSSNAIPHVVSIDDTVTYNITIHNPSTTKPITNVNLTDTLPTGLTFKTGSVIVNSTPNAFANPTTGISIPSIAANSDATVSFVADVTAAPSGGALKYVNTATAQYSFESPDSTTLTSSVTANNTIYPESIVITPNVIKTANTNVASVSDVITYTITAENTSNSTPITNVTLTDILPSGLSFNAGSLKINNTPNSGSPVTGVSIGNINPNATTTIEFSATINTKPVNGTSYVNTANIAYQFNSPAGNISNTVTSTNTIYSGDIVPNPEVIKSSNPKFADVGDVITYTITVRNSSPLLNISNANIKDTLPSGLSYNPDSLIVNGVPNSGSIISGITINNLNSNATATVNYTATVTDPPSGNLPYTNSINVDYNYVFPDGSNFRDNVTSTNNLYPNNILVKPTLSLSVDKNNVSTGDTINFTVLVSNNNSTTIENPILTDILPNGLEYIQGTLKIDGAYSSDSLRTGVTLPNMPQNSSHTITFSVNVNTPPNTGMEYTNYVTLNYNFQSSMGNLTNTINSNTVNIINNDVGVKPITFKNYVYRTNKNTSIKETLTAANINNSPMLFTMIDAPINGFAAINEYGTFRYTPKVNFVGTDRFIVSATNDLGGSTNITVIILVEEFPQSLNYAINCKK
ncbi:beta strand repeat-containing protein [Clostridium botulinum]|uniref:beta strand repeat-containing protein n=1 Tax=Clostridium botulinum TaxID=1491 RepID=UPI0004D8ED78|nr:isopeptide-forming domain-containing fimbrial protein [Clostridium botulinum]KEI02681.1 hypothetical protein Z952_09100 [Clostridium botulinum C/D str. BKT75002]KEI13211.1 hypothetical protein Z954_08975 [Clostridium botulinum C/D str. BKT2873]MCD3352175.1 DUF11 domain-containing protein [Clostridium botulinum D/C]MCD3361124.1 DUF11 domain-containing protein [Clostridium botulinum D/C]MCD3363630.1 DUF11 domain-containing protein [Clostridium botulinum D/C]